MRAGRGAAPPYNLRAALIFQACWVCVVVALLLFLQGKQTRREADDRAAASWEGPGGGLSGACWCSLRLEL